MRTVPQAAIDLITQPKEAGVRATFRKTLPVFSHATISESIVLSGTSWVDACAYGTGILRVTNVGNVLYTQYVSDVHGVWPSWTNTGIALYASSVPAVDGGYVWYQKADGYLCYRNYPAWSTEVNPNKQFLTATTVAPIANRAFVMYKIATGTYEITYALGFASRFTLIGPTVLPRFDAVNFDNKDYLYTMDRDAGRIVEIVHAGAGGSGQDIYGVPKSIVPIDAIDDVYGLKLGYAGIVDSKVVVTGKLTRTSDDTPVTMDIYTAGPENFTLGNEMFIQSDYDARGKLLHVGTEFIVSAPGHLWTSKATTLFGGTGHTDLEITTSDLSSFALSEAEGRSTNLNIDLSTDLSHSAIAVGSDVVLEMAYNNNWTKLTTVSANVDDATVSEDGLARMVSGVGKSAKKLGQWAPDQGVYVPSQAKMFDQAGNMTKVVRAAGLWERISEDGPIVLKDLNKAGVLYSVNRAARGGSMRGLFFYPADATFKPVYGVGINYYRETGVEAAQRLGVEVSELEEEDYSLNGIFALYSKTNGGGGVPGMSVDLWRNGSVYPLKTIDITIPEETWHWLEIAFVEGAILVRYRAYSDTTWTTIGNVDYNLGFSPWSTDTLGRGAIYIYNGVPTSTCYPLTSTDKTLALESHSTFPSSGTVLVDGEEMTYSAKSSATAPDNWEEGTIPPGWDVSPHLYPIYNYAIRWDIAPGFTGSRIAMWTIPGPYDGGWSDGDASDLVDGDNAYNGLAIVLMGSRLKNGKLQYLRSGGRTCRITGWDKIYPRMWMDSVVPIYAQGWKAHMGNLTYGSWSGPGGFDDVVGLYTDEDLYQWLGFGDYPWEGMPNAVSGDILAYAAVKPALHISGRGANGTTATSHDVTTAKYKPAATVWLDYVASFTQEEDQSIEDALKTIVTLAGGKAVCRSVVDAVRSFTANQVFNIPGAHKNFIMSFDLPLLADGASIGLAFRGSSTWTWGSGKISNVSNDGYFLEIIRSGTEFRIGVRSRTSIGNFVERLHIWTDGLGGSNYARLAIGTIKVSVQDGYTSVWLNGRFLYTFVDTIHVTGTEVALYSSAVTSFKVHLSELDDLLADIVVGTRGNGMSVLSELLADRHIIWRDDQDGSMFFYRNRGWVGDMPDIVINARDTQTDDVVSRMRSEGLNISEIMDPALIKAYGNRFVTTNARYANNVEETHREALFLIDEGWRGSKPRTYSIVPHPGLQPGDAANFTERGVQHDMIVRGQSMTIGFAGNNFVAEMQCDVIPFERE
jgi:hypothetical protein